MKSLVSVVIPIYNVELYLRRCLHSVMNQTYSYIEVILVNDGSSDCSLDIAREYTERDNRFKLICKENGGLSEARNVGIKMATGKFITFIDSDDYVSVQYIERMLQILNETNADVVGISWKKFTDENEIENSGIFKRKIKEYSNIEAIKEMCYQRFITNSACGKIYRTEFFEKVCFPIGRLYEDLGTTYKLLYQAKKVVFSSEKLYYYYQRNDSIMNNSFSLKKMDRIIVSEELLQWTLSECPELTDAAVARFFISNVQVLREIPYESKYENEISLLKGNIEKYRWNIVKDKNVKKINRLIAIVSIFDIRFLKILGNIYKIFWK